MLSQFVKKGSPYLITERRVPELIPVLGSQTAGDVSHKPDGRLPLLSARSAVTVACCELRQHYVCLTFTFTFTCEYTHRIEYTHSRLAAWHSGRTSVSGR